ncbi:MAG: hypothetical protein HS115_04815 [Spirochaetales bacterium]|nr:hypothetical protein [Spirochaetales bacterium]
MKEYRCSCGRGPGDDGVEIHSSYSLWGYIKLGLVGITAMPREITFYCSSCRQSFARTSDKKTIAEFSR